MDIHFLQSPAWQAFQEALGRRTFSTGGDGWHYLAILEESGGFKRLYCPYGPVASSDESLAEALASLKALAKDNGATFLRVQPTGADFSREQLSHHHLHPIDFSQPSHTWLLDLQEDTDTLLANMKQNNRNIYRNYAKKGLVYETSQNPADIDHLTSLLHHTAEKNRISVHSDSYFQTQAEALLPLDAASLHFMKYDDAIIAAALVYEDATTSYYAHAASSFEHRNLNAATALLGEIIFDAKRKGKRYFDFYGIAPTDDPKHRWAGFNAFKKSFGGFERTYSDTYELPVRPLAYLAYSLLRKLR